MAPPGKHCKNRVFEWAMAIALVGLGIHLLIWPGSVAASKFVLVLNILGVSVLTLMALFFGLLRATALYLNGNWPKWGARIRSISAFGGMSIWLQMAYSLIVIQQTNDQDPSPSVWPLLVLAGAELYSSYRAAADART